MNPKKKIRAPITEETRAKMRVAKIGYIPWNKGQIGVQISSRKGKSGLCSQETLKKMSESHLGKTQTIESNLKRSETNKKLGIKPPVMYGADNPSWRGGITPEIHKIRYGPEYESWRKNIFIRDNHVCQKYGTKGGNLVAHHVLNFSDYVELRFSVDNGITLSEKAHVEFHKIYGKKNNTREQLNEFIKSPSHHES
jgi:hypothetical protein